jgi:hypothetical protein
VFAALTALAPLAAAAHRRVGPFAVAVPVLVVAGFDVARFGTGAALPWWLTVLDVLAAWLVPFQVGVAWASGGFRSRWAGPVLLAGGLLAVGALVLAAGYPASMVGVTGASRSNLSPPTLVAVAFALAQAGLVLTVRDPLGRLLTRPAVWAAVALLNLKAMAVFLWHQSALLAVTLVAASAGTVPGLGADPRDLAWVGTRLCWLPVFAVTLLVLARLAGSVSLRRCLPRRCLPGARGQAVGGRAAGAG